MEPRDHYWRLNMDAEEKIRARIDEVSQIYPDQRERLERCAKAVIESGSDMLHKSFDKQLQRIIGATTREQAARYVDKMGHTLFESTLFSSLLGGGEESQRRRMWIGVGVVIVLILIFAGEFVLRTMQMT